MFITKLQGFFDFVLQQEGLCGWTVTTIAPPSECRSLEQEIGLSKTLDGMPENYILEVFLHEIAHAISPSGHDAEFYERYGNLLIKYAIMIEYLLDYHA